MSKKAAKPKGKLWEVEVIETVTRTYKVCVRAPDRDEAQQRAAREVHDELNDHMPTEMVRRVVAAGWPSELND
jgi:hypothetical protein